MASRAWLSTSAVIVAALMIQVPASAEPTPGIACQLEGLDGATRIVPDPEQTNDYISFEEALECFDAIEAVAPDYFEMLAVGQSAGWTNQAGESVSFPVLAIEITNETSVLPHSAKLKHVFQLSVHGNEKGGREGGLRVIEDLARCLDIPGSITADYPELCGYLDQMVAVFTFPNPDGWSHEELDIYANDPSTGFTRENGNGFDLNRQFPNRGWVRDSYRTLSQPEIQSLVAYYRSLANIETATDIHGMLTPTDADIQGEAQDAPEDHRYEPGGSLLEGLLDAGQADPLKMLRTTRLAEMLKERVNTDPNLIEWTAAPNTGAWGGQVMEWGTSWDTIGYVDSGFTGDFFFQRHGLNATAMDFEMAYNHIACDNHYGGCGTETNRLHVRLVRQIVAVFMESSVADVQMSIESGGSRAAWLYNPTVVTSQAPDGGSDPLLGWAANNTEDDAYDYAHVPYEVHGNEYFEDLSTFLRAGDRPGVLETIQPSELRAARLASYESLIVAGSSYETIARNDVARDAILRWVESGGNLVLTDSAFKMLVDEGIVGETDVRLVTAYAGYVDFDDPDHDLAAGLRGLARQTYDAIPLGYEPNQAPIWAIVPAAIEDLEGTIVGSVITSGADGAQERLPDYGEFPYGKGNIRFLGALLPDPTEDYYHPYGVESYATTYTGNQLLLNMMAWHELYDEPPRIVTDPGLVRDLNATDGSNQNATDPNGAGAPGPGALLLAISLLVGAVATARRRH